MVYADALRSVRVLLTGAATATWPLRHPSLQRLRPEVDTLALRFYPQSLIVHRGLLLLPLDRTHAGRRRASRRGAQAPAARWPGNRQSPTAAAVAARGDARADGLALVTADATGACRVLLLDPEKGVERRAAAGRLRRDAAQLAAGLDRRPAPDRLLLESLADADRTEPAGGQRRDATAKTAAPFALPLTREDGEIVDVRQVHGPDFLAFVARPNTRRRLPPLVRAALQDRSGMLPNGRRYRTVAGARATSMRWRRSARSVRHRPGRAACVLFAADRGPR
jgi:hypothetical protein